MPPSPPTLRYATPPRRRRFPHTLIFAIEANVVSLLLALSWLQYPTGSSPSLVGTDIFALILAATSLLLLPFAIYQLIKRQFLLATLNVVLALTPLPIYFAVGALIWILKGFHYAPSR